MNKLITFSLLCIAMSSPLLAKRVLKPHEYYEVAISNNSSHTYLVMLSRSRNRRTLITPGTQADIMIPKANFPVTLLAMNAFLPDYIIDEQQLADLSEYDMQQIHKSGPECSGARYFRVTNVTSASDFMTDRKIFYIEQLCAPVHIRQQLHLTISIDDKNIHLSLKA